MKVFYDVSCHGMGVSLWIWLESRIYGSLRARDFGPIVLKGCPFFPNGVNVKGIHRPTPEMWAKRRLRVICHIDMTFLKDPYPL